MSTTHKLQLPYILTGQSQKEVTHNQALNLLDIFVKPTVLAIGQNTPPASPNIGDCYIVGQNPTDEFTGQENNIAYYTENGWIFAATFKWLDVINEADDNRYIYDGTNWVPFGLLLQDSGEYLRIEYLAEDITNMAGSTITSNIQIPDRALVIAVNVRVTTAITGANGFDIGVAGDTSRYGSNIAISQDTTNIGMSLHPTSYYADTAVIFTALGGNFTAGAVHLSIQYLKSRGAWNW